MGTLCKKCTFVLQIKVNGSKFGFYKKNYLICNSWSNLFKI